MCAILDAKIIQMYGRSHRRGKIAINSPGGCLSAVAIFDFPLCPTCNVHITLKAHTLRKAYHGRVLHSVRKVGHTSRTHTHTESSVGRMHTLNTK